MLRVHGQHLTGPKGRIPTQVKRMVFGPKMYGCLCLFLFLTFNFFLFFFLFHLNLLFINLIKG